MTPKSVGIRDVARRAGVSLGTVSHVLNHPERVSTVTRERVRDAIEELGFVRNGSAARLRASSSNAVGLVVLDAGNPFFADVSRGVEEVMEQHGFIVMVCSSDANPQREQRHLRFLEEQRVAGVLITPTTARSAATRLSALRKRGVAIVLVDEPVRRSDQCSVAVDDVRGGELAGEHLVAIGRRRIVYVTGPPDVRQLEDRRAGLVDAVERSSAGGERVTVEVMRLPAVNSRAGHRAVDELLSLRPDAVFCGNDLVALGMMRGLAERGVAVPSDIALVGFDDIEFAGMSGIPLTTVRQPAVGIGQAAAQLLIEECTSESHEHRQVIFQPELVVRRSSGG
jgi:LacI family transcriptional regulator